MFAKSAVNNFPIEINIRNRNRNRGYREVCGAVCPILKSTYYVRTAFFFSNPKPYSIQCVMARSRYLVLGEVLVIVRFLLFKMLLCFRAFSLFQFHFHFIRCHWSNEKHTAQIKFSVESRAQIGNWLLLIRVL